MTIRNVVTGKLREGADDAARTELAEALAGIAALDLPGMSNLHVGTDLGLRAGGWDFAITNDWVDEAAYRNYDADPEHNVHRARIVAVTEQISRVQILLD